MTVTVKSLTTHLRAWTALLDLIGRGSEPMDALAIVSVEYRLSAEQMRQLITAWGQHLSER